MEQQIYNEGRVVGLSAWELFAKTSLANGVPESAIPNEQQWLTAMIGAGASMILKVPANTSEGIYEVDLPSGSNLTASGLIIANPFMGTCEWDSTSGWAKKIISYGGLIENIHGSKNQQDTFSGDGVTSTFTLTNTPSTVDSVTIGGVSIADYTLEINKITLIHEENDSFEGDGTTKTFNLSAYAIELTSVTVDGTVIPEEDYGLDADSRTVTFVTAPSNQSDIVITYSAAPISGTDNIIVNYTYVASPDRNTTVPENTNYSTATYRNCVSEFAKITDGIVFTKTAQWIENDAGNKPPEKDINPDFNNSSTSVRLYINSQIKSEVAVLLTGFNNKRILQGVSRYAAESSGHSVGGSTDVNLNNWPDGGMLGPEVIPWATKIVFCVPSSAYNLANSLTRTIPADTDITNPNYDHDTKTLFDYTLKDFDDATVKPNSFIDFNSINLIDYYNNNSITGSTLTEDVSDLALGISDELNELVAWYPGMTSTAINAQVDGSKFFPPALYAAQIDSSGTGKVLVPVDVAAPGTVKGFNNSTVAYNYTQTVPNTYAVFYNNTEKTFSFVTPGQSDPTTWSGTSKLTYKTAPKAELVVGNTKADFIALTDSSGNAYTTDGTSGEYNPTGTNKTNRYYTWDNMFSALTQGKKMDILGSTLTSLGQEMESNAHTIGVAANSPVSEVKTSKVTLKDNNVQLGTTSVSYTGLTSSLMTLTNGASIKVGTNFIEFSNGRRLFISESAPTSGMRAGDIGIGW